MKMITPAKLLRSLREGVDEIAHRPRHRRSRPRVGRADDRHRHAVADGRVSASRLDEPADATRRAARHLDTRRRRRRARLGCRRAVGGARGPAGAQRARGHQGHPVGGLDAVGPGRPRRRARPERHAREPRPRHARRRRRAVRRGRRARTGRRGTEVDPLPDAARRGVRPRSRHARDDATTTRSRSPARAVTATTGSCTPAATSPAPRCSARSTNRRSVPASRC